MNIKSIVSVLIFVSILLTALGGSIDFSGKETIFGISKKHAWHDGLYVLFLALVLYIVFGKN